MFRIRFLIKCNISGECILLTYSYLDGLDMIIVHNFNKLAIKCSFLAVISLMDIEIVLRKNPSEI